MIIENLKQPSFKQNPPIFFRDYKKFNKEAFKTELRDVKLGFETFLRFVNKTLDKHAPIKTVKKREHKIISKLWINRGIKTSIKKRDELYKQMIKAKNKQRKLIKHESYKKYRNKVIQLIRQSKQTYYQRYFEHNKKDSRSIR